MVIEIPEWKFKTDKDRNTAFEGNDDQTFAQSGSKMTKSDYFYSFYFSFCFSQSVETNC